MSDYNSFVKDFYENNVHNEIIISKEKLFNKMSLSFLGGLWGSLKDNVKSSIQYEKQNIIFAFDKCVYFKSDVICFLCIGLDFLTVETKIININLNTSRNKVSITNDEIEVIHESESSRSLITKKGFFFYKNKESTKNPYTFKFSEKYFEVLKNFISGWYDYKYQFEKSVQESKRIQELNRVESLNQRKSSVLSEIDKDNDGNVDLVDCESFIKLLNKNQKSIIEIDKIYVQKFVKISMYIKTKKTNIQKLFLTIKKSGDEGELNELVYLLRNQIHTYDLMIFHSINMLTSLINNDLLTFYEIYECFDQTGVFNSNWENEVSSKLSEINVGIKDLMYSIQKMEDSIVNSINNMTYMTQESFKELNDTVNQQLSSIDSSIKFNNLLTGIQTYQMYKVNQNTRRNLD